MVGSKDLVCGGSITVQLHIWGFWMENCSIWAMEEPDVMGLAALGRGLNCLNGVKRG